MGHTRVRQATSVDVAKAAGVSRAVVSRTFSNNGYVSDENRNKVLEAAAVLGYRVNYLARSLNQQRSDLVGLVVADMDTPFRSQQLKHLSEALVNNHYRPLLIPTADDRDSSKVIDMLLCYSVSGVIITSDTPPPEIYRHCIKHQVPVILINKEDQHPKVDRVICDNRQGIELLAEAFIAEGCQQIAIIGSTSGSFSISQRETLFLDIMKRRGIKTDLIRVAKHDYCASNNLLDYLLSLPQLPDGIFCTNDLLALSVVDALKEHNSPQLLDTIKIAGFDDIPQAAWLSYQLTTVNQSTRHQAEAAVKLLLRRIEQPDAPEHKEVTKVILIRRNTL